MRERIESLYPKDETISDLNAVFRVVYNLLAEKIEEDPTKGMVLSRGNPNQRKISWTKAMRLAHMLEDYFMFRKKLIGDNRCENCIYWSSISEASPHMGCCQKRNKTPIHKWYICKKFEGMSHE